MRRLEGRARRMGTWGGRSIGQEREMEAGEIKEFNGDSQLTSEFKISLGYLRFCLKTRQTKQ